MPRLWIIVVVVGGIVLSSVTTGLFVSSRLSKNTNSSVVSNINTNSTQEDTSNQNVAVAENTNTTNTNTQPVNTNTTPIVSKPKPAPVTVDPAIKIELCKSKAETAEQGAKTACTEEKQAAYKTDPEYTAADSAIQACINYPYTVPSTPIPAGYFQQLIDSCTAPWDTVQASIKNKYLDEIPDCMDEVYQNTYTTCLNS